MLRGQYFIEFACLKIAKNFTGSIGHVEGLPDILNISNKGAAIEDPAPEFDRTCYPEIVNGHTSIHG